MHVETIAYELAGKSYAGVLIQDAAVKRPRPAVLTGLKWMRVTNKAVERGMLLAGNRYVVFVADMYGKGVRHTDFGEAAAL